MDPTEHPDMGPPSQEVPDGGLINPEEDWRICPGYPAYSVSALGQIRYDRPPKGCPQPILTPVWSDVRKVLVVPLSYGGHPREGVLPELVLRAFVGLPNPVSRDVLYKDGNPLNCAAANLVWKHGTSFADQPKVQTLRQSPAAESSAEQRVAKFAAENREEVQGEIQWRKDIPPDVRNDPRLAAMIFALQERKGMPVGPHAWERLRGLEDVPMGHWNPMKVTVAEVVAELIQTNMQVGVAKLAGPAARAHAQNSWARENDAALTASMHPGPLPGEVWYPIPKPLLAYVQYSASTYGRIRPDEQLRAGRKVGRPVGVQGHPGSRVRQNASTCSLFFIVRGIGFSVAKVTLIAALAALKRGENVPDMTWRPSEAELRICDPVFSELWGAYHLDQDPLNCCLWNLAARWRARSRG